MTAQQGAPLQPERSAAGAADAAPRYSPAGHRVAIQAAANAKQHSTTVVMHARTSRGLVVVRAYDEREAKEIGPYWSVTHLRLTCAGSRRRITREDLRPLEWRGEGPDPEAATGRPS